MKYLEVFKLSFKMQIVWRFDVIMTVAATIARIFAAWLIWGAVYGSMGEVAGMSLSAMMSYSVVSSLLASLNKAQNVSGEMSGIIREGRFSGHMVVPMNPLAYFGFMVLGEAAFPFVFSLLAAVLCTFVMGINVILAAGALTAILGVCMALMGVVFMIAFQYAMGVLAFKFLSINSFIFIVNHLIWFATGAMVPLVLLPEWARGAMSFLPFYYVNYMPSMLLTGSETGGAVTGTLILAVWTAICLVLGQVLYGRLRVRYDGVGI